MSEKPEVIDMPEGKLEMSIRLMNNEVIGFKMVVDDFKMKWVLVGIAAMFAIAYMASSFGPVIANTFGG